MVYELVDFLRCDFHFLSKHCTGWAVELGTISRGHAWRTPTGESSYDFITLCASSMKATLVFPPWPAVGAFACEWLPAAWKGSPSAQPERAFWGRAREVGRVASRSQGGGVGLHTDPMRKGQRGDWSGREETLRPDQRLPSMNFPDKNTSKKNQSDSPPPHLSQHTHPILKGHDPWRQRLRLPLNQAYVN